MVAEKMFLIRLPHPQALSIAQYIVRLFQSRNILFLVINAFGKFSISSEKFGMMLICNI